MIRDNFIFRTEFEMNINSLFDGESLQLEELALPLSIGSKMYAENECLTSSQNMCLKEFNNLSFLKQNPNAYENEKGKRKDTLQLLYKAYVAAPIA
jgi:hypothetical protein